MTAIRHQMSAAQESENRSKAGVFSLFFHMALLAIMYFYRFGNSEIAEPPTAIAIDLEWGGGGDNAAAGEPDKGMNDDYTPPGESEPTPTTATPPPAPAATPVTKPEPARATPTTPTTEDPNVAALRKKQADDKRRAEDAERQRVAQENARITEAKRVADEKARAEAEKRNKIKQGGSAFGKPGSNGQGAGGGGNGGNGGINGGTGTDPFGKSNGQGGGSGGGSGGGTGVSIGGGLGGRAVRFRPTISDNSQDVGKVVVEVCVDKDGNVISANYTMRGSTAQSTNLKNIAVAAAKKFRFAAGSGQDCGTIAFNFQLQ